ncbi:PAS domain S-box protein [Pararhodobacter oceanensis]|uniref:sensor histidine kinase n=1 Tax=Pararhodobacter oceanensis TaxID=2172121 RepID=UPI003A93C2C9
MNTHNTIDADTSSRTGNLLLLPQMIVDTAGWIVFANHPADTLFGYDADALNGRNVTDILSINSVDDLVAGASQSHDTMVVEGVTGRSAGGEAIALTVQISTCALEGRASRYVVILQEAVAASSAEAAFRADYQRLSNAIKGAEIATWEYDRTTGKISVCDIWREVLQISSHDSDLIQKEWVARMHPEDGIELNAGLQRLLNGEIERFEDEYRFRSKSRTEWIWVHSDLAVAGRDLEGNVTRVSGAMMDVTKRRETEEALRRSVEQFRSTFDSAAVGMAILGAEGEFIEVNPRLSEMLGFTTEELLASSIRKITHPDDLKADLERLQRFENSKLNTFQFDKRFVRADGSVMWAILSVAKVRDDDGAFDHYIGQLIDVTSQHQQQQLKGEFISTINHELRTPLTSIIGSLMLLTSMDTEALSEDAKRLLYIAKKNGDRMHELINDVLDFEKFSGGHMHMHLSSQRISALVEDAISANLGAAHTYGVDFELFAPARAATCLVDPQRFQQVMTNLLSNAAKFANQASTIEVRVEEKGSDVCVSVTNFGEPIPEAFRDRIFEPFAQANSTSTRERGGTGLGLAIAKQIVEQTGGKIGFQTTEDGKTTFWFTLPR